MSETFSRCERLLGAAAMARLRKSRVAIFGLGGVGGHAMEALARSGVGALMLIDADRVSESNLNRQIIATRATLGMRKVDAAAARLREICPEIALDCRDRFVLPANIGEFDFTGLDYVVDAIDTVSGKLAIIERARTAGVPVISAMGAGNKLDPGRFRVADIYETRVCPLARVMRRLLRQRGVERLKVVYSDEEPRPAGEAGGAPGSLAFVTAVAGLLLAGEVVRDLIADGEG